MRRYGFLGVVGFGVALLACGGETARISPHADADPPSQALPDASDESLVDASSPPAFEFEGWAFGCDCQPGIGPAGGGGWVKIVYRAGAQTAEWHITASTFRLRAGKREGFWFAAMVPPGSGLLGAGEVLGVTHWVSQATGHGDHPCDFNGGTVSLEITVSGPDGVRVIATPEQTLSCPG